jgi:hypothetical protein
MGTKIVPIMSLTAEVFRFGNQEYLSAREIAGKIGPAVLQKSRITDWQL